MIDITAAELKIVQDIVKRYAANSVVWAFGSRVRGTAKPYSDLDLVVISEAKLEQASLYALQEAFQESILSFRVDVMDWHRISESFREVIKEQYEVIAVSSDEA